jgi:hypothetical protein
VSPSLNVVEVYLLSSRLDQRNTEDDIDTSEKESEGSDEEVMTSLRYVILVQMYKL